MASDWHDPRQQALADAVKTAGGFVPTIEDIARTLRDDLQRAPEIKRQIDERLFTDLWRSVEDARAEYHRLLGGYPVKDVEDWVTAVETVLADANRLYDAVREVTDSIKEDDVDDIVWTVVDDIRSDVRALGNQLASAGQAVQDLEQAIRIAKQEA